LVLLDDKVELEVPLDDLAVHEPDARKLIAFLKAMEFSTLTRRVAEYSQIDPSDVEADAGNKSGASVFGVFPIAEKVDERDGPTARPSASSGDLFADQNAGGKAVAPGKGSSDRQDRVVKSERHPDFAGHRARGGDPENPDWPKELSDGAQPRSAQGLACARTRYGHFVIEVMSDSIDPMRAEISGIAGAGAQRCLLSPSAKSGRVAVRCYSIRASHRTRSRLSMRFLY
jgi:DNA polymerase-1